MTINGVEIDTGAIGAGLYQIIAQRGQDAIVAFGMIPKDVMDMAEGLMREKISAVWAAQHGGAIERAKLDDIVRPAIREICSGIYGAAKAAGKMVV